MPRAIEVDSLVVRYDAAVPVTAVDGISFSVELGTVLALLGPNGAGKTTTVETLEGYRVPTSGHVRVLGLDPRRDAKALSPRMGVMLQRNGVYLTMGPAEVVRLFAAYYGDRALPPDDLVDRVGLTGVAKTPWRRLSGGEQQRLSLALALIGRPEVVFLDEPTAGIDPAARLVVRDVIRDLRADGVCVLLTTHDLDEAEKLADRVVIVDHGRVVADGTSAELMRSGTGHGIRFGAPAGLDVAALSTRLDSAVREERPGEYHAACDASPANVARLTAWLAEYDLPLGDLRAGRQSLEDVFLRLTATRDAAAAEPVGGAGTRRRRSRTP